MSEDMPLASPRTAEEPMAFTRDELGRGAFCAWGIFMALMLGGLITLFIGGGLQSTLRSPSGFMSLVGTVIFVFVYAGLIGGIISLLVMVLGLPVAWLLGRALRRVTAAGVHLLFYSAFGIVAGAAAMWAVALLFPGSNIEDPVGWIVAASAFVAVPTGWWLTARRALREDRGLARRRREAADPDAEFEDAATVPQADEL